MNMKSACGAPGVSCVFGHQERLAASDCATAEIHEPCWAPTKIPNGGLGHERVVRRFRYRQGLPRGWLAYDSPRFLPVWLFHGQGHGGPTLFGVGRCGVVGGGRRRFSGRAAILGPGAEEKGLRVEGRVLTGATSSGALSRGRANLVADSARDPYFARSCPLMTRYVRFQCHAMRGGLQK
jgi:hypothetical protein